MATYIKENGFELGINGLRIIDDAGNVKYKLPTSDGTNGQIIKTNGAGELSFITPASLTGNKGEKGDNGSAGTKGDKGEIGSSGTSGSKGDKGDAGTSGTSGTKGDKGDKGDTGTAGTSGAKGDTGASGTKGDKGDTGSKGDTGDASTVPGVKGDKGDTGSKGDKGEAGGFTTGSDAQVNSLGVGTAASAVTGQIRATNSITAFYSDERLKQNIKEIENALEKIEQLKGVYYTQNALAEKFGYNDYSRQVGVLAQDVQKVLPEAVTGAPFDIDREGNSISGEKYLTVYYEKIIPLLIQSIKELKKLIDSK